MTEREEAAYTQGGRMAWLFVLREALWRLDPAFEGGTESQIDRLTRQIAVLKIHEEEARQALFSLVRDLTEGSEDAMPSPKLALADVVEKYVRRRIDL